MISLIVGLGNPGARYASTRHNAGFAFVDRLASAGSVPFQDSVKFQGALASLRMDGGAVWLFKPGTFMNLSGRPVRALSAYYRIPPEQILVAHDELDLPPGVVRLKQGGGHGGHNGLKDICQRLGSGDFLRLRIGIGHPGAKEAVVGYVLGKAPPEECERIDTAIGSAMEILPLLQGGDLQAAMHRLHSQ